MDEQSAIPEGEGSSEGECDLAIAPPVIDRFSGRGVAPGTTHSPASASAEQATLGPLSSHADVWPPRSNYWPSTTDSVASPAGDPFPVPPPSRGFNTPSGYATPSAWPAQVPATPLAPFGAPLAGWWQRAGALLLDILILDVPFFLVSGIATSATHTTVDGVTHNNGAVVAIVSIIFFVAQGLYFTFFNGTGRGQTPGNRAPGIAVRDVRTGAVIGAGRGFLRWFVRLLLYVLVIPGIVNDLMPLWSRHRQTIADKAANSVMVRM